MPCGTGGTWAGAAELPQRAFFAAAAVSHCCFSVAYALHHDFFAARGRWAFSLPALETLPGEYLRWVP